MPRQNPLANDFDLVAEEIDLLVLDRVQQAVPAEIDQTVARINADLEARTAALHLNIRAATKSNAEVEAWLPNRFPRGATVSHNGGSWRCIATQGEEPTHEPNPESPA